MVAEDNNQLWYFVSQGLGQERLNYETGGAHAKSGTMRHFVKSSALE